MAIDSISPLRSAAQTNTNTNNTTNTSNSTDTQNNTNTQNSTNTPPVSTADGKTATLNYDSFLKLLVAQMKNQDPTDPVDATQQMSQLASFSNVEQSIKMNAHLESLIQETTLSQASSLIGKTVTSADGKTSGVVASVEIKSDGLTAVTKDGHEIVIQTGITVASTDTSASSQ